MRRFEALLEDAPVLLDGATGTNLIAAGMTRGECPEAWMLAHEATVLGLQRRYAAAGSRIFYTPTLTALPGRLARWGLEGQTERINERLARLTRSAAPDGVVAGGLTTLMGAVDACSAAGFEEAVAQVRRQIRGLMAGGVDVLIGETLMGMTDAQVILRAAALERAPGVMLSFSLSPDGRLRSGEDAGDAFAQLHRAGTVALGVNCMPADARLPALMRHLRACVDAPLICKPNAGLPTQTAQGALVYPTGDRAFAQIIMACIDAGASLVGGCCGTTPETIAALAKRIDGKTVRAYNKGGK